ncbi:hypothetical protein TIFTF001_054589 [Ficus carica]|uniref:Uncharacterized protein n=1 Tax=Ficus carica TaxID=3494 RepID=A0AA88ECB5_FICCA|nr:hypothetical protein TIFTF001_054589 [Ficus carica]
MYLVSNPGWTEEDCEASLAFRGMEEELRIFDRTQGVVARYGDPLQILSGRDASSRYACQPMPSRGGSCKMPWHMCLDSVVISRQCANNKLVEANKNLVDYDDGYELDDEIKDMIS